MEKKIVIFLVIAGLLIGTVVAINLGGSGVTGKAAPGITYYCWGDSITDFQITMGTSSPHSWYSQRSWSPYCFTSANTCNSYCKSQGYPAGLVGTNKYECICSSLASWTKVKPVSSINICTDSDGGKVYNVKGTVTGDKSRGGPYTDRCEGNQLREFYCKQDGWADSQYYTCPSGQVCSDGTCISKCVPLVKNGNPEEKIDLVFVPDDYMSNEELFSGDTLSFKTRVTKFIDYNSVGGGLFSKEPFKSNKDLFNIYLVNINENKDCQIPDENGGDAGACMAWAREKAELCGAYDSVVVLSDDLSGTGGLSGYAFTGLNFAQITPFRGSREYALAHPELDLDPVIGVFIHEFGHSFGNLKDEYYTYNVFDDPSQYTNCDSFGCPKWCSGAPILSEPQYKECSQITAQQACEDASFNPPCIWIQIYGEDVCRGTFSDQNFGVNCLSGYSCYQGCEGLNGYRSMLGCNIMGGKCTGNEDWWTLDFSPQAKDVLMKQFIELSG